MKSRGFDQAVGRTGGRHEYNERELQQGLETPWDQDGKRQCQAVPDDEFQSWICIRGNRQVVVGFQ